MKKLTKNAISLSFRGMLERMPFDKITVSALVKECGINHNTFYYYYQDIYQLLDEWITQTLGRYTQESRSGGLEKGIRDLLHKCREQRTIVYHIFDSLSRDHLERYLFSSTDDMLYRHIRQQVAGKQITEQQLQSIANFCRYALIGYFLRFLWDSMEDDIDQSVKNLSLMFRGFITQSIEQFACPDLAFPATNRTDGSNQTI